MDLQFLNKKEFGKLGLVSITLAIWKAEERELQIQYQPGLQKKFKASLSNLVKNLSQIEKNKIKKKWLGV